MSVLNRLKPRVLEVALPEIFDLVPKLDKDDVPVIDKETGEPVMEAQSLVIYLMTMTWAKWNEVGSSVPDVDRRAIPKITTFDNVTGKKQLMDDVQEINRQTLHAQGERLFRRIGYAMQQAMDTDGNPHYPELQGKSLEELADAIRVFDQHVVQCVGGVLIQYEEGSRAFLKRRSDSFRGESA